MSNPQFTNDIAPLDIAPLIDTHTHFDDYAFEADRLQLATEAYASGVRHIILVGYLATYFSRLKSVKNELQQANMSTDHNNVDECTQVPAVHIATGLHPAYIAQHRDADLDDLADFVKDNPQVAIGEIGLDTFTEDLKTADSIAKQKRFFTAQLDLAVDHQLPVLLHIRKAHAEALAILKSHTYDAKKLGGIAHSFSGGEQEAKAFVELGFKLGITGQVTNSNAKKLRRSILAAVDEYGIGCLVLETDCPDMTPVQCQKGHNTRNVPANLAVVLSSLSELLHLDRRKLAHQLWQNSCEALQVDWLYPPSAKPSQ